MVTATDHRLLIKNNSRLQQILVIQIIKLLAVASDTLVILTMHMITFPGDDCHNKNLYYCIHKINVKPLI